MKAKKLSDKYFYVFPNKKKAMSGILVTLITILIALAAINLVWIVVQNVVGDGVGDVSYTTKCLDVAMQITNVECNAGICNLTYKRLTGEEEFSGVKLILTSDDEKNNYIYSVPGNLVPLGMSTESFIDTGLNVVGNVELAVYFLDEDGDEQICPVSSSKTL